jgi:hypothetical protein
MNRTVPALAAVGKRILLHLAIFLAGIVFCSFCYFEICVPGPTRTPSGTVGVTDRLPWYLKHRKDFDLVFLGDSRTYCGIHPGLIDPQLHTRGISLGQFSDWLPTQWPMIQDIAPLIPPGTTVVWSIGEANFGKVISVQRIYPIGWARALQLRAWGLDAPGLADNALFYSPATCLLTDRARARTLVFKFVSDPKEFLSMCAFDFYLHWWTPHDPEPRPIPQTADRRAKGPFEFAWAPGQWTMDPRIDYSNLVRSEDGSVNSAVLFTKRGGYYRIELIPSFFRGKQRETYQPISDSKAAVIPLLWPDPTYWRLFNEILAIFKRYHINLIVNEMDQAPFVFGNPILQQRNEIQMRTMVATQVEKFGFRYIHVDFDKLTNEDYFDYNHLNSRGIAKFTPMLVEQLRPLVSVPR